MVNSRRLNEGDDQFDGQKDDGISRGRTQDAHFAGASMLEMEARSLLENN